MSNSWRFPIHSPSFCLRYWRAVDWVNTPLLTISPTTSFSARNCPFRWPSPTGLPSYQRTVASALSLDPSERSSEHVYELVFETREIDPVTGAPVSGTLRRDVLSKIVLSNTSYEQHRHPSWNGHTTTKRGVVMLDVSEFRSGSGCQRLSDTMDVLVSAYHPHIDSADLRLVGGSGALPSPPTITPGSDNEVATTETFNISSLTPCAYNLWLDVSYDLTGGYGRVDDDHDYIGFCVGEGNGSD